MHIVQRTAGVIVAATAVTATFLPPAQATAQVTLRDRLGEIAHVDDAVPIAKSPTNAVRDGRVTLGHSASSVSLDLPVTRSTATKSDGRYVLPAHGDASVAVAPTSSGTQILIGIESQDAPTSYGFGLDAPGLGAQITPDGGIDLTDAAGRLALQVQAPWAIDAQGRRVPTRYELSGGAITQVVDHRAGDFDYPIVADPKVKFCDFATAVCVKFTKKETKRVAKAFSTSIGAGVSTLCGNIPGGTPAGWAVKAICVVAVNEYIGRIRKAFLKARKAGKCAQLKFRIVGPPIVTAKVVKC